MERAESLEDWKNILLEEPDHANKIYFDPESPFDEMREKNTVLHLAAHNFFGVDSSILVPFLLENGGDPNTRNNNGDTSLHIAYKFGNRDIVACKALIEAGAKVNLQNASGNTPLHLACRAIHGDLEFIEILIDAGADLNLRNKKGKTPIELLAVHACVDYVSSFLDKLKGNQGKETGDRPR